MVIKANEVAIQKWFDDMEGRPGLYHALDEIGEGDSISPKERVHEMLLKRLYGQTITLHFPKTKELGEITSVSGGAITTVMDHRTLDNDLTFKSLSVGEGVLKLNWDSLLVTFLPNGADIEDLNTWFTYQINHLHVLDVRADPIHKLHLNIVVDMVRLEESDDGEVSGSIGLSKDHIEKGILHQEQGYQTSKAVTFKEVSEITGITRSTLSDLKNGKKLIDNLTHASFAILSQYGYVRKIDSMIYDAFLSIDARRSEAEKQLLDYKEHRIYIETKHGKVFHLRLNRADAAEQFFKEIEESLQNDELTINLSFAFMSDDTQLANLLLFKRDIICVYRHSVHPYEEPKELNRFLSSMK